MSVMSLKHTKLVIRIVWSFFFKRILYLNPCKYVVFILFLRAVYTAIPCTKRSGGRTFTRILQYCSSASGHDEK